MDRQLAPANIYRMGLTDSPCTLEPPRKYCDRGFLSKVLKIGENTMASALRSGRGSYLDVSLHDETVSGVETIPVSS